MGLTTVRFVVGISLFCGLLNAQKLSGFDAGALDKNADPCVNFYQYACGGWLAANPVPGDQSRWGRFDALQERNRTILQGILEAASANKPTRTVIEQKIGDYYASCMDTKLIDQKGLAPIQPDLDRIDAMNGKPAITAVVTGLYRIGSNPFFNFTSEPDSKNSSEIIAGLDQGGLGLPDRDYYFRTDDKSVEIRKQYVAHLLKMFELLGNSTEVASKRADAVMKIETALAKGSMDSVARRDPTAVYHRLTVKELISLSPGFDWEKFFEGVGVPGLQSLDVSVPPFVRAMESVIVLSSLDDIKSYLTAKLLTDRSIILPTKFQEETFDFYGHILAGAKEMRARWKRCTDQTDNALPDALGQRFVEKTLGVEGMKRTHELVAALEKALGRDIQSLDWMTPKTKEAAMVKLHAIMNKVGTKEHWLDYAGVHVVRGDAYGNFARTNEFELHRQLQKIGKPFDRSDWQMSQPTVNAYYDPQENGINFPAGILQPPFYDNKMDDAVNFGGIGAVIGHELTHGFDDQGRQFDAEGNLRDWWTEADAKAFEQRADCLVREYSGFVGPGDARLNGKLELGENTADNGGLRVAYMALMETLDGKQPPKRDGLTAEQRFFLGWGQVWCENITEESARLQAQTNPHALSEFRVNGVVSNMPEFQKAFACRIGQPMVRYPACRVW
jgi:endothelin-converting enzyme/putative endopeptidase